MAYAPTNSFLRQRLDEDRPRPFQGHAEASAGLSRNISSRIGGEGRSDSMAQSAVSMRHQWRQHTNTNGFIPGPRSGANINLPNNTLTASPRLSHLLLPCCDPTINHRARLASSSSSQRGAILLLDDDEDFIPLQTLLDSQLRSQKT